MSPNKKKLEDLKITAPNIAQFNIGVDRPAGYYDNRKHSPVFSFHSLNLSQSNLCFDNPELKCEDYHGLFGKLKQITSKTYEELKQQNHFFKFHEVDFDDQDLGVSLLDFKKAITNRPDTLKDEDVPTCWQFEAYQEARIFGYLGNFGVFFMVWFDRDHIVYPRNK
jgi:hypothetical protein